MYACKYDVQKCMDQTIKGDIVIPLPTGSSSSSSSSFIPCGAIATVANDDGFVRFALCTEESTEVLVPEDGIASR